MEKRKFKISTVQGAGAGNPFKQIMPVAGLTFTK